MIEFTVTFKDADGVERTLTGLSERMDNLAPAMMLIGEQILAEEHQVFEAEGAYRGRPAWAALSDDYAEWKAEHFPGAGILEVSGAGLRIGQKKKGAQRAAMVSAFGSSLRASLTDQESEYNIFEYDAEHLLFGSDKMVGDYNLAALHHEGTENMPARPPLTVVPEQVDDWMEIFERHLTEGAA